MKDALPIDEVLPQIVAALREGSSLVLEAPPGAGKTTRVPPALLPLVEGTILVLEPRRIAARTAARRVAQELGERVGETAGYQVRFERVASERTRIEYVTEGILSRRLVGDPELRSVSAVVLDEFHERHLHGDVALALLLRLQERRRELKLVVMSATLETSAIAAHLRCPIVRSEGRRFPVAIEHLERPDERRLGDSAAAAVRRVTTGDGAGDVLVFLPGAAEIRHAQAACEEIARHRELLVLPLHGDLSADEQDRALARSPRRKIILSTNVAETSLTIEGVTTVIDSGLARIAAHSPWSGLPSLQIAKVSRASAVQRAGRAGRTAPGRALRLYTRQDFEARPDHHPPELLRLDLAETVLELRAAGIEPMELPWLDPPPQGSLGAAEELLRRLGAVDARGRITELGRACARLPAHPRLGRLVLEAWARGYGHDGCVAAALIGEREAGDVVELLELRRSFAEEQAVEQLSRALRQARPPPKGGAGAARGGGTSAARGGGTSAARGGGTSAARGGGRDEAIELSVLAGFPDRVARRRGDELLLAGGGTAQLSTAARLGDASLLVAVDVEERSGRALVRLASRIEPEWLLDLFSDALRETTELVWERERVLEQSRLSYGAIVLEESLRPARPDDPKAAELLRQHASFDQELIGQLRARTALVAQHCPEAGVRALTDEDVAEAERELCLGCSSLAELRQRDLAAALAARAGPRHVLDALAPEQVALASGRKLRVEYAPAQPPAVRSRIQDFFGLARGPAIAGGRLPLVLHLLAPNGRAQQVTQDLAGFWQRHYPAVRRELMRRYPRHPWPEDGATASPPPPRTR